MNENRTSTFLPSGLSASSGYGYEDDPYAAQVMLTQYRPGMSVGSIEGLASEPYGTANLGGFDAGALVGQLVDAGTGIAVGVMTSKQHKLQREAEEKAQRRQLRLEKERTKQAAAAAAAASGSASGGTPWGLVLGGLSLVAVLGLGTVYFLKK